VRSARRSSERESIALTQLIFSSNYKYPIGREVTKIFIAASSYIFDLLSNSHEFMVQYSSPGKDLS